MTTLICPHCEFGPIGPDEPIQGRCPICFLKFPSTDFPIVFPSVASYVSNFESLSRVSPSESRLHTLFPNHGIPTVPQQTPDPFYFPAPSWQRETLTSRDSGFNESGPDDDQITEPDSGFIGSSDGHKSGAGKMHAHDSDIGPPDIDLNTWNFSLPSNEHQGIDSGSGRGSNPSESEGRLGLAQDFAPLASYLNSQPLNQVESSRLFFESILGSTQTSEKRKEKERDREGDKHAYGSSLKKHYSKSRPIDIPHVSLRSDNSCRVQKLAKARKSTMQAEAAAIEISREIGVGQLAGSYRIAQTEMEPASLPKRFQCNDARCTGRFCMFYNWSAHQQSCKLYESATSNNGQTAKRLRCQFTNCLPDNLFASGKELAEHLIETHTRTCAGCNLTFDPYNVDVNSMHRKQCHLSIDRELEDADDLAESYTKREFGPQDLENNLLFSNVHVLEAGPGEVADVLNTVPAIKKEEEDQIPSSRSSQEISPQSRLISLEPSKSESQETPSTNMTTPQDATPPAIDQSPIFTQSRHSNLRLPRRAQRTMSQRLFKTMRPSKAHSQAWLAMLPWVNQHFKEILGGDNAGAIELLSVGRVPTICITVKDEDRVNHNLLKDYLSGTEGPSFEIKVGRGIVKRSGPDEHMEDISIDDEDDPAEIWSDYYPLNAEYQPSPCCGASIGIAKDPENETGTASFGGLVELKFDGKWFVYGITSHHLLEDRTPDTPELKGVMHGRMNDKEIHIQQPSRADLRTALHIVRSQLGHYQEMGEDSPVMGSSYREEKVERQTRMEARIRRYEELMDSESRCTDFGRVIFSSGYGSMWGHQMDWALIGSIPSNRLLPNEKIKAFLNKESRATFCTPTMKMVKVYKQEVTQHYLGSQLPCGAEYYSFPLPSPRMFGVGSVTGFQDGFLSDSPSLLQLEDFAPHSLEWGFASRFENGLGISGDSGSWIFDDFGTLLGMILAYNSFTHVTYFTRMDLVFEHIKRITGAEDVRPAAAESVRDVQWHGDSMLGN